MSDFEVDSDYQQEYNNYLATVNALDGWPPMDPPEWHRDDVDWAEDWLPGEECE